MLGFCQYLWRHHEMRCDCNGVVAAARVGLSVPVVVRLAGTNVELGKAIRGERPRAHSCR